jgi:hypothetical protein
MANERVRRSIEFQFGVDLGSTDNSIAGLERQLEKLQEEFKNTEIGSARFKELGLEIQKTQSQLKTLDERFEGLGAEQKATAIADSFNVLVGSVGAVTGALVAFGVESEALEGVEKRLLGIITVVTSLREVSNGLQAFIKIWPLLTANISKATLALRAFALANPFTAILAGVVALTAGIIALVKAQDDEVDVAKKLNDEYKQQQQNLKDLKDQRDKIAAAQGETEVERLTRLKAENEQELKNARDRVEFYKQQKFQGEDLNNQLKIIREAKLQQPVLEAQLAAANKDANEKIREENKKTADELAKQNADALKAAEDLRLSRLDAAQKGAEGLFAIEQDLLKTLRDIRLKEVETGLDAFEFFTIDDETLELVKADLIEKEALLRETRLAELDKTTADLLKQNENYFAQVIEGVGIGSEAYINEEKKFQAIRTAILEADAQARIKLTTDETNEIFNANFKLAKMLNDLAKGEGDKILSIEFNTYAKRKDAVIQYYDAVIAAARAAGLKVEELERQKSDALKSIDDQRRKDIEQGVRNTLSAFSTFLSTQRDIIDSQLQADLLALGNNENAKNRLREQAFQQQKKLRIAEATISGITGAVDAFTSVQNLNKLIPGLGIAVGGVLAGLVLATTGQQISLIQGSSLGGNVSSTGFNNIGGGSFSLGAGGTSIAPSLGATLPGLGGGRLGSAPTVGTLEQEPIRAYVLAGDVTNGVQANIALNNRRRLAG